MAVDPRALLMAQLAGGGAPPDAPPGPPPVMPGEPGAPDTGGPIGPDMGGLPTDDPLQATQQVIQDLHALIGVLPSPDHTKIAAQCLTALTGIQRDLMRPQGPGGAPSGGGPPGA